MRNKQELEKHEWVMVWVGFIAQICLIYLDWKIALALFFMMWSNNMMIIKKIKDVYKKKDFDANF